MVSSGPERRRALGQPARPQRRAFRGALQPAPLRLLRRARRVRRLRRRGGRARLARARARARGSLVLEQRERARHRGGVAEDAAVHQRRRALRAHRGQALEACAERTAKERRRRLVSSSRRRADDEVRAEGPCSSQEARRTARRRRVERAALRRNAAPVGHRAARPAAAQRARRRRGVGARRPRPGQWRPRRGRAGRVGGGAARGRVGRGGGGAAPGRAGAAAEPLRARLHQDLLAVHLAAHQAERGGGRPLLGVRLVRLEAQREPDVAHRLDAGRRLHRQPELRVCAPARRLARPARGLGVPGADAAAAPRRRRLR